VYYRPSFADRMRAAETLSRKILPDLKATELSGPGGDSIQVEQVSDLEVARRIAFILARAAHKIPPPA
jgi:hypothetical protein